MLFGIIQLIVLSSDDTSGKFIEIAAKFTLISGVVVNAIFLVVILASDQSAYKQVEDINESDSI